MFERTPRQNGWLLAGFEISNFKSEKSLAESCSCQLRGWADSPQDSEIKGQRYLTGKSRRQDEQKKRAAAIQKELLRKVPPSHPLRANAAERGRI